MRKVIGLFAALVTCTVGLAPAAPSFAAPADPLSPVTDGPTVSSDQAAYAKALKSDDWMRTPQGLMHKDCVHQAPEGATVDHGDIILASGERRTFAPCRYPRLVKPGKAAATRPGGLSAAPDATGATQPPLPTSGWLSTTWWYSPTWVRKMTSSYIVPSAPTTNGALHFFFSSLEPAANNEIVQPVLTYGTNASIGGNYWYVNSWWVGPGSSIIGPTVNLSVGDTVLGSMEGTGCSSTGTNCTWIVKSTNARTGAVSQISVTSSQAFTSVQGEAFESYAASSCNQFPASRKVSFRNIKIYGPTLNQLTPSFFAWYPAPECGMTETFTATSSDIQWTD